MDVHGRGKGNGDIFLTMASVGIGCHFPSPSANREVDEAWDPTFAYTLTD